MSTKNKSSSGAKSARVVSCKVAPAPSMGIPKDVSALQPPTPLDETERMLTLQMALKVADLGHLAEELEVGHALLPALYWHLALEFAPSW